MKKPASPDNRIAYIASAIALAILSGSLVWYYMGYRSGIYGSPATNTKIGPIDFKVQTVSARITLELQSNSENTRWARQHQGALEQAIDETLARTDPELMAASNQTKFNTFEARILSDINAKYPEAQVKKVYVTDFVSSQN